MNKSLEQVQEFHEVFNHRIGNLNELEPLDVRQLRIKLLFEELQELAEASDCVATFETLCKDATGNESKEVSKFDGNIVNQLEELDALCDIQYVLNGKIITAGMHKIFDGEFDKVHQNNMSKAHRDKDHAYETVAKLNGNTSDYTFNWYDQKCILTNSAGKIIKPHDHQKVQLSLTPDL
jgi:predicted HAD superfamily Cof-like phosphohydrolase